MIMCLYLSYLTHFRGQGRNPSNNFVAFLENLRHHNFVLRLSDLQVDNNGPNLANIVKERPHIQKKQRKSFGGESRKFCSVKLLLQQQQSICLLLPKWPIHDHMSMPKWRKRPIYLLANRLETSPCAMSAPGRRCYCFY